MKTLICILAAIAVLVIVAATASADTTNDTEIVDGFHGVERMHKIERREPGGEFVNRFAVPTREQAMAKITRLRETKELVTVRSFLGGKIRFVRVTFFDDSLKDFETARFFLQDLLGSTIISASPSPLTEGPFLQPAWAEGSEDSIRALIFYENGSIGRIESDGWHLFLEDSEGTYWWQRLKTPINRNKHGS